MIQPYPMCDTSKIDEAAETELEWVKTFVTGVRKIRSERDLAPGKPLAMLLQNASKTDISNFENNQAFINSLAKLESFEWIDGNATVPESAMALVGEMKILVPLAGIIDKVAELARLDKDIAKHEDNIEKGNAKLSNAGFTDKAPAAVVDKERQRVAELIKTLEQLKEQAEKIKAL